MSTSHMHIGLVGPIATADIKHLLDGDITRLPKGYAGGPLLATLITELLARGHTVSAFTLTNDLPLKTDAAVTAIGADNRFSLHYVPMRPKAWRPNGWLPGRIMDFFRFEIQGLKRAILERKPEVLHAHWVYEFALAAIDTGLPHVITCHDSPLTIAKLNSRSRPTHSLYRWLRVLMARKTFKSAKLVTAVSPYMRDEVQGMTKTPIQVVSNPVDDLAIELSAIRDIDNRPAIAMICNGWTAWKNPEPGLVAFNKLLGRVPAASLHLYGNDFGAGQIAEKWCKAKGIEKNMKFHGAVPHKQLLHSLAKHDLLLHTSLEESFGMALAEAMAMGCPVVGGEESGAVPWVLNNCGVLCDIKDENDIYRALMIAIDPENYKELAKKSIANASDRFTTSVIVDGYTKAYASALSNNTVSLQLDRKQTI
ncbi:glycosyltransferase family 4 protein [Rhodoferax sp. TBRC 17198]|uniref:glycosyltransferase family 4 protein n=1 Tax=Rhodoferax potami TaxID=3068338 RepID=UPI0028BDA07D|nr:glycosyltransferase family 4 protein [Rhodoferax sp. TBRC 17198]MDT7522964.1 glycosyltransferase family 4 protein [Rhodoferax sp. TBRC 17198]